MDNNKKKMLYIMGIDWEWIYQRPQAIAQRLTQYFDITVIFPRSILNIFRYKDINDMKKIVYSILWTLPYQEKNCFIKAISNTINARLFKNINEYDYIYIGYPLYVRYILPDYKGKVIYDCLDNFEALYPDPKRVVNLITQENKIINMCDLLFASSLHLCRKVNEIAGYDKSMLVRNGVEISNIKQIMESQIKTNYIIGYIGTISKWFDYSLIKSSLQEIKNIRYKLIGPSDKINDHDYVEYIGVIPHEKLEEAIENYDCLIMPFIINEITNAVDPVKLYEYIAFGKCIVSVFYPELEHFRDYIYFYSTKEDYIILLQMLSLQGFPVKYTKEQQESFIRKNTWDERVNNISQAIRILEKDNLDEV